MTTRKIIVGVDGTETAARALQWAAAEGRFRNVPVVALLAWGACDQHHAVIGPEYDPAYGDAHAIAALRTYVHEALDEDDANLVKQQVVNDLPARSLLEAAVGAEMLVVGGRPMGQAKQLLVGSVTSQCLSHAPCPVAVVHGSAKASPQERTGIVVVGIDEAEWSDALRFAADEARVRDARLDIVHAWQVPVTGGIGTVSGYSDPKLPKQAALRVLEAAHDAVTSDSTNKPPETSAIYGDAADVLVEHAQNADLIVVGTRGRGGFKGLLLGSVARRVSRLANCPVVVVPPAE